MLLIDVQDQRSLSTVPLTIAEEDLEALLAECGEEYDTPLELRVRLRDARSFDDMGTIRALDEALTSFRLVLFVLPYKTELSEAARRVLNRNMAHNVKHLVQLRQQGPVLYTLCAAQNEIDAVVAAHKSVTEVLKK